ncbi:MAG: nucleotide exchange factor GrpE [Candidatus Aminicenantes bacterium]|nr:nucleotide exchange factor GrpE [Candidatus Aminicenantes bacterium]
MATETSPLAEVEEDLRALIKSAGTLRREAEDARKQGDEAAKKILLEVIAVADAFENVLRNAEAGGAAEEPKCRAALNSVRTVQKMLVRALKSSEAVAMEILVGDKANPHWHNVVEVEANIGLETGTITEVIKKGYLWRGKLLRAAEVKAVRNR